jgi:integrase
MAKRKQDNPADHIDDNGRWTFPFTVPDGVSVFKPTGSSERSKWRIAYRPFRGAKRKVERVSHDATVTYHRALELARIVSRAAADPAEARFDQAEHKSLSQHLDDFEKDLLADGDTPKHANQVRSRCERVFSLCGSARISHLLPSPIKRAIADLKDNRGKPGAKRDRSASLQTRNHYLRAVKQFAAWLVKEKRAKENLLLHIEGQNVKTDRRHDRQDLGDEAAARLIAAAESGPVVCGLAGHDRAMLYETALESGFRANECGTLTPARCHLDGDHPELTVKAAYAKAGREDQQPIRKSFAARLKAYIAGKPAHLPIWKVPAEAVNLLRSDKTGEGDLQRARQTWIDEAKTPAELQRREASDFLRYIDDEGRFADFHCLRHTFICRLVRAGVLPKECQVLARHASIMQTMDYYAHLKLHDTTRAIARVPELPDHRGGKKEPQAMRATGTDGVESVQPPKPRVAQRERVNVSGCLRMSQTTDEAGGAAAELKPMHSGISGGNEGSGEMHLPGLEPGTFGSVDSSSRRRKPQRESAVSDYAAPEGSAEGSAPAIPTPEQLRAAIERVTDLIAAGRLERDHAAGILLLDQEGGSR